MPWGAPVYRPSTDRWRLTARPRTQGSSLIEALIAILLLCIGLLAMARLSSMAIAHQKSAQVRLTAQSLTQRYVDLARINLYGFDLGAYDIGPSDTPPQALELNADEPDPKTAAERMASEARREWLTAVRNTLPGGRAVVVTRADAAVREIDVWILWPEASANDDDLRAAVQDACPSHLDEDALAGMACLHFRSRL